MKRYISLTSAVAFALLLTAACTKVKQEETVTEPGTTQEAPAPTTPEPTMPPDTMTPPAEGQPQQDQ